MTPAKSYKKLSRFPLLTTAIFALFASVAGPIFAEQDSVITQANVLIREGKYEAAYQLLEPLESKRAGEVDYDILFGIAGVESNHATRGAFALERVLALDPTNKDARAEMAKAHFILGEKDAAKAEFNNVLKQNPDAPTKQSIDKFLAAIEKLEGSRATYGAYMEFGFGLDSNVSSAPGIKSFAVPAFGGIRLDLPAASRAQSDHFLQLAGGLSARLPINERLSAFGSVSGTQRMNGDQKAFDNSTLDFNAGLQLQLDKSSLSLGLQDNHFDLDAAAFRHAYGVTAQWQYNIDAYNQAGVYGQFTRLNYANNINDAERIVIGINAAHAFQDNFNSVIFGSFYGGRERARRIESRDKSQDILGVRAGGQMSFNPTLQMYANTSYEYRNNDTQDPFFLTVRADNQFDFSLGLSYSPVASFTIRPQISYTNNHSNIETNSYDRKTASVLFRKDFNW
jgi:outer membrane protein